MHSRRFSLEFAPLFVLLAVAATLDRVDRAADAPAARADPRYGFLLSALALLQSDVPDRAERIQRLYSKE